MARLKSRNEQKRLGRNTIFFFFKNIIYQIHSIHLIDQLTLLPVLLMGPHSCSCVNKAYGLGYPSSFPLLINPMGKIFQAKSARKENPLRACGLSTPPKTRRILKLLQPSLKLHAELIGTCQNDDDNIKTRLKHNIFFFPKKYIRFIPFIQ